VASEEGVEELPPPVPDPYARWFVGAALALAAILAFARRRGPRR
jgi:hypothetical protein